MPILPTFDDAWKNLPKSVDTLLPDIPEIAADAGNAPVFSVLHGMYAATAAEIFQLASQVGLGSLVANVGMPVMSTFDTILDALQIDVKAEVTAKLMEGGRNLLEAYKAIKNGGEQGQELAQISVETAVGAGIDLAAVIPVAGWVVKIIWGLGKALKGIAEIARSKGAEGAKAQYPPTTFNPQLDNGIVNAVLADIYGKRAWGRRWSPPAMGMGVGTLSDFSVVSTEGGGFELVRKAGTQGGEPIDWASAGWLGMIPGTPYLHQGIQVDHSGGVRDIGEILLPSAREVLLWLWGSVMGHGAAVTPAMWCVDTLEVQLWGQYIADLHQFVYADLKASPKIKQRIIDHFNARSGQKVFGWGTSIKPKANEHDHYEPLRQAKTLYDRQMGYLDTLMCAYVDDSYAAIAADSAMRDRWEQRRRQLLEHPARCDVDISNVPDAEYREALRDAGAASMMCRAGPARFAAELKPEAEIPVGTTYSPPSSGARPSRGLPLFVPLAALSLVAYAGYKAGYIPALKLPSVK